MTAPTTSVDVFLWRSYLIFAACTAPPTLGQDNLSSSAASESGLVIMTTMTSLHPSVVVVYGLLVTCSGLLCRCCIMRERLKKLRPQHLD